MYFTDQLEENMTWLNQALHVDKNFDVVYRVLTIADKKACLYFIDGFTKDDSLLKILQGFSSIKTDDMPEDAHSFSKKYLPYGEIGLLSDSREMIIQLLSGVSCLFIDGYNKCLTIDCRTYPARGCTLLINTCGSAVNNSSKIRPFFLISFVSTSSLCSDR